MRCLSVSVGASFVRATMMVLATTTGPEARRRRIVSCIGGRISKSRTRGHTVGVRSPMRACHHRGRRPVARACVSLSSRHAPCRVTSGACALGNLWRAKKTKNRLLLYVMTQPAMQPSYSSSSFFFSLLFSSSFLFFFLKTHRRTVACAASCMSLGTLAVVSEWSSVWMREHRCRQSRLDFVLAHHG